MKYLLLLLLLSACTVGNATTAVETLSQFPEVSMDNECFFTTNNECNFGTITNNAQIAEGLILDRGATYEIAYPFTFNKGTIKLNVTGLIQKDPSYCNGYNIYQVTNWNTSCPVHHELATFYENDVEVFKIVLTQRDTQYDTWPATLNIKFSSPNSPYVDPAQGFVDLWRDGVVCRFQDIGSHSITINYDFSTINTLGHNYTNTTDYMFIECDGIPGRPRLMDEIPIITADKVVFKNTHPSIEAEEILQINYFAFDNKDAEWCGNGYCAIGENSCARDCGCETGFLDFTTNTCNTDYAHLEYFGHYRTTALNDFSLLNKNPGNIYVGDEERNYFNQYVMTGDEGSGSINHPSFGHGMLALTENACQEFDKYNEVASRDLTTNEIAWAVLDEPTHPIHNFSYEAIDYTITGIKNLYPELQTYVVYNYDEQAPPSIDWIGIDPYIFPYNTTGCAEYGNFYRMMYYTWNEKMFPTITHYEQFNKPIILVGRSFESYQGSAMPSLCQQNWYYELALGNPQVIGLINFAWSHPAVIDLKEYGSQELYDYYNNLGDNYEVTQTIPEKQSSIPPGTYTEKNDHDYDENLNISVTYYHPILPNGATRYTQPFTITTPQNTYSVKYFDKKYTTAETFSLNIGEAYQGIELIALTDTTATIQYESNTYELYVDGTEINNKFLFHRGQGNFVYTSKDHQDIKGFLIDDTTEILANGNRKHMERIRDLDPNHYTMMTLDFAMNNLCNSFYDMMSDTDTVQALYLDEEIYTVWANKNYIYLAFKNECQNTEETCNNVDDNCNLIIDEYCNGDYNGDGFITIADLTSAVELFRIKEGDSLWNPNYDLVNDKIINILDFVVLSQNLS